MAKATELMVRSPTLAARFRIVHLDTSDVAGFAKMGSLDWGNVVLGLRHVGRLVRLLWRQRPVVTLLTASQGKFALVRDWLFVGFSRVAGARIATYLRGSRYAEMRARQGRLAAAMLRSILKQSSRTLVLGESLAGMARAVYPDARVAVAPNGCPPAVRAGQVGGRDEDHPVVAYIGRLSQAKGLTDLVVAAGDIAASVPAVEFVLCGEWDSPAYEAEIKQLVQAGRLSAAVRFAGPVSGEEKTGVFARAWALAVPSHSEGQPWVILEAMSAGLPVVATDTGSIAETVADGVGGFVVRVGDSASLAARLTALCQDDELWRRMSQGARQRYEESFTVERSHTVLAEELGAIVRGE